MLNRFFVGLIMLIGGAYLLLQSIHVDNSFNFNHSMYNVGGVTVTSGYILIPFIFGIGMMFFNHKSIWGWVLTIGSLVMLVFGVISNTNFRLAQMTAFQLITILVLLVGGIGLLLSALRSESQ